MNKESEKIGIDEYREKYLDPMGRQLAQDCNAATRGLPIEMVQRALFKAGVYAILERRS